MRLLLDTQIAIWALTNPDRLSNRAVALIGDADSEVFVSAASVWEIAIKFALGKPHGAPPFSGTDAIAAFEEAGYRLLSISPRHVAGVDELPALHADPFDRILIAQARFEPLRLLTADSQLAQYGDSVLEI